MKTLRIQKFVQYIWWSIYLGAIIPWATFDGKNVAVLLVAFQYISVMSSQDRIIVWANRDIYSQIFQSSGPTCIQIVVYRNFKLSNQCCSDNLIGYNQPAFTQQLPPSPYIQTVVLLIRSYKAHSM